MKHLGEGKTLPQREDTQIFMFKITYHTLQLKINHIHNVLRKREGAVPELTVSIKGRLHSKKSFLFTPNASCSMSLLLCCSVDGPFEVSDYRHVCLGAVNLHSNVARL